MKGQTQNEKSSTARTCAIVFLFILIPVWVFYISTQYTKHGDSLTDREAELRPYLEN